VPVRVAVQADVANWAADRASVARVLKTVLRLVPMQADSGVAGPDFAATATEVRLRDFSRVPEKSPGVRVLIVDDEPLVRWSLAETLVEYGCAVMQAPDWRSAVVALNDAPAAFDVIMLDYWLPDSNTLKSLATIRAMSPRSRVVLMTAFGTPELAAEALRLGAFCVVDKPFDMHVAADVAMSAQSLIPYP